MASRCSRIFQRSSVSTLKSAISKPASSSLNRSATTPLTRSSLPSNSVSSPIRRFSLSRSPVELGGVASMLPLHSAVAKARMTSCLSSSSRSCRALSQGTLCCTSPDLYLVCQFRGDFVVSRVAENERQAMVSVDPSTYIQLELPSNTN